MRKKTAIKRSRPTKTKNTIRLMQALATAFILLSTTSFGQTAVQSTNQVPIAEKAIQTKIDIGGYALYVNIAGEGSPAVVFESGSGNTGSIWGRVQPAISNIARTLSYDRAGLGKSDRRTLPNTSLTQVQELHALLKKANIQGPYILVANSYGAFQAKLFANTYPNEVSGVVFVDGTSEKLVEYLSENLAPDQLNILKKMGASSPDGNYEEMLISAQQVKKAGEQDALRNRPVIVLTSDFNLLNKQFAKTPQAIAMSQWMNWQKELAALSDRSGQYTIKGSGHLIHWDKPQVVINAIMKMIGYDLKDRQSPSYKRIEIAPDKLRKFVGKYEYDKFYFLTITEENGHLFADIPYLIQTEVYPISETEVITEDMDVAATIIRLTGSGIIIKNSYSGEEKQAKRADNLK